LFDQIVVHFDPTPTSIEATSSDRIPTIVSAENMTLDIPVVENAGVVAVVARLPSAYSPVPVMVSPTTGRSVGPADAVGTPYAHASARTQPGFVVMVALYKTLRCRATANDPR